jgi:hypothetical protein
MVTSDQDISVGTIILHPRRFSRIYDARLEFAVNRTPRVILNNPDLLMLSGGKDLPHVYEGATIKVFPAPPVSAAVEVGRVWMPKADLPMTVFDQIVRLAGSSLHCGFSETAGRSFELVQDLLFTELAQRFALCAGIPFCRLPNTLWVTPQ